jgi:hypothetical protein
MDDLVELLAEELGELARLTGHARERERKLRPPLPAAA